MIFLARTLLFTVSLFVSVDDLDHACLEGLVFDSAGNAVARALIIARNSNTGRELKTATGPDGRYRLEKLPAGDYVLNVESSGFRSEFLAIKGLTSGAARRHNFELQPSLLSADITVSGGDAQSHADHTRTVLGETLTRGDIDGLPTESRNPYDLLFA